MLLDLWQKLVGNFDSESMDIAFAHTKGSADDIGMRFFDGCYYSLIVDLFEGIILDLVSEFLSDIVESNIDLHLIWCTLPADG